MTAATDTHDNEDYINTATAATAATAEKGNNNKIGWECKRWWWQWKPKGDLFCFYAVQESYIQSLRGVN